MSLGLVKLNVAWLEKRKKQIPFPSTFVNIGDRFFKKGSCNLAQHILILQWTKSFE
jgi:hypothetical protein